MRRTLSLRVGGWREVDPARSDFMDALHAVGPLAFAPWVILEIENDFVILAKRGAVQARNVYQLDRAVSYAVSKLQ